MGRFDELLKTVGKVANPEIEEGDETKLADSPRNLVTNGLNKVLPENWQLPLQTVAEDKRYMLDLPETMAGATMGSIGKPKVTNTLSHTEVMGHPLMQEFLANNSLKTATHPSQYTNAKQNTIDQIRKLLLGQ